MSGRRGGALRAFRTVALAATVVIVALVLFAAIRIQTHPVAGLARSAPERTALMKQREREAKSAGRALRIDRRWTSYERISPTLRRAILIAEDDKFFSHDGLDWDEIQQAARKNLEKKRIVRGGSTITQQLAKNLFLGDARTLTRKFEEAFLAMRLERALPKRRIFELYLNSIEWGDGIFGAEAAARRYFGVSASRLSDRQAVLLAAVIINPRRFSVLHPNRRIERRVRLIASRMKRRGYLSPEGYAAAIGAQAPPSKRALTDWFFGAPGGERGAESPGLESPRPETPPGDAAGPDSTLSPSAAPETTTAADDHDPVECRPDRRRAAYTASAKHTTWGREQTPLLPLPRQLRAGQVVEIRWERPPGEIEEMELLLSIDGGRHFALRISPEIDPGTQRFLWRVPNLGSDDARIAMRVGREARRERGARHDETLLMPSEPFRIVADRDAPAAKIALREGWTPVGDVMERAAPPTAMLRPPASTLSTTRFAPSIEPPPRAPHMASPVASVVERSRGRSRTARVHARRRAYARDFQPMRN